jgi:hypothetical protein
LHGPRVGNQNRARHRPLDGHRHRVIARSHDSSREQV